MGLMVEDNFPQLVADAAHNAEDSWILAHTQGFCRACAAIYAAIMKVVVYNNDGLITSTQTKKKEEINEL